MSGSKLWIAFHHHRDEEIDDWELYLTTDDTADCESWAAIGQRLEFRAMHLRGVRSEAMPGFKDMWLLRGDLTKAEVDIVRRVISQQPIDNEADHWDGRVYCFEIVHQLERKGILRRDDQTYHDTRLKLRAKWETNDGRIGRTSTGPGEDEPMYGCEEMNQVNGCKIGNIGSRTFAKGGLRTEDKGLLKGLDQRPQQSQKRKLQVCFSDTNP